MSVEKPLNPYHHIYFFSPQTLTSLFKIAGYNIYELNSVSSNTMSLKSIAHKILAKIVGMGHSGRIEAIIGPK